MYPDFVRGLKCRLCGKQYPKQPLNFCTDDFGPLEVEYDYDAIAEVINRGKIELRPRTMWRYRELLPLDGEPTVGPQVGGTPLIRADRLADALGVEKLWIKNDAVNFPTLSFKDRVVSVALSKAREFGFISLPYLALSAFLLIVALLWLADDAGDPELLESLADPFGCATRTERWRTQAGKLTTSTKIRIKLERTRMTNPSQP